MEPLTVERSIWIAARRERVWQAITDARQIMAWWGGDYWEIAGLEPGAAIKFGSADDPMLARVAAAEPPQRFVIEWPPQPQYHEIPILTTYVLAEEAGGTRVTVTETGFEALPADIRQQRFESTAAGYAKVLEGLKQFLEPAQP